MPTQAHAYINIELFHKGDQRNGLRSKRDFTYDYHSLEIILDPTELLLLLIVPVPTFFFDFRAKNEYVRATNPTQRINYKLFPEKRKMLSWSLIVLFRGYILILTSCGGV